MFPLIAPHVERRPTAPTEDEVFREGDATWRVPAIRHEGLDPRCRALGEAHHGLAAAEGWEGHDPLVHPDLAEPLPVLHCEDPAWHAGSGRARPAGEVDDVVRDVRVAILPKLIDVHTKIMLDLRPLSFGALVTLGRSGWGGGGEGSA